MNLLIVDDEPLEREVLTMIINKGKLGIDRVVEAKNGMDAVQLATEKQIDLVLMDIEMPVMDGLTAARMIKKNLPDCRIIFLTANNENDLAEQIIPKETNEYLLKPAHPHDIIQALTKHIPVEQRPMMNPVRSEGFSRHPEIAIIMEHIKNNLHLDLKLDYLAELVHFNGQYLSRL